MDCITGINRKTMLNIFPLLFGVSAWLGIYATFLQMPIIVKKAPEGWSLPSFVVVLIQIGNIGPLLYTMLQKYRPIKDSYLIYFMLSVGLSGALLFSQFYDVTVNIFDDERSLPLLGSVLMFSLMACTSSVLFMPYMGRFQEGYLVSYFTGVSFGGLISSSITLLQGIGKEEKIICHNHTMEINVTDISPEPQEEPNISVATFFLIISCIFLISSISFFLIDTLKIFKNEYANVVIRYGNDYTFNQEEVSINAGTGTENNEKKTEKLKKLSSINYQNLMLLTGLISATFNAIIPGVLSYATLPFGTHTYHYTITFVYIGEPLAYIFGNFIPHSSIRLVWSLATFAIIPCTYIMINAVMSPFPPLLGTLIGSILTISSWVIAKICYAFINLSLMSIFRAQGGKSLVRLGGYTQIGSFLGSVFIFSLVNFTSIFKQYDPCAS
uniref:Riboflavin transporter n=1 Tax=Culicoides sonorensis TaxID=179676 RepID=A0A336MBL6_CULSO